AGTKREFRFRQRTGRAARAARVANGFDHGRSEVDAVGGDASTNGLTRPCVKSRNERPEQKKDNFARRVILDFRDPRIWATRKAVDLDDDDEKCVRQEARTNPEDKVSLGNNEGSKSTSDNDDDIASVIGSFLLSPNLDEEKRSRQEACMKQEDKVGLGSNEGENSSSGSDNDDDVASAIG
ncbi:Hypothetical predicted protein, partial [Paramuricea clavata]